MAIGMKQMSMIIATLGVLSFLFGVIAENKKGLSETTSLPSQGMGKAAYTPPSDYTGYVVVLYLWCVSSQPAAGTAISGKGVVICKYKSDPTVALGYLSFVFLSASSVAGFLSLFYPYQGKSVPQAALLRNTSFVVFLNIALGTTGLAATLLLWPTITEQLHITRNIHHNLQTDCPTAKTGLLGGGAFLSLDSALFWLVALMLADNAREDYFQETDVKGEPKASYADDEIIKSSA